MSAPDRSAMPGRARGRIACLVAVAVCTLIAYGVRFQYFVIHGGAEPSYTDWAVTHYFGGLTECYLLIGEAIFEGTWPTLLSYPPGYGVLIQIVRTFGADTLQAVRLVQVGFDALSVVPLYLLLRRLGIGAIGSIAGGLLYALYPLFARGSIYLLADSIAPALVVWLLLSIAGALAARSAVRWGATGLLGGLATICRPDFILLSIVLGGVIVFVQRGRRKLRCLAVFVVAFALPVLTVGVMHRVNNGVWVFTSVAGSYALYSGLGQVPSEAVTMRYDHEWLAELDALGIEWQSPESAAFFKARWLEVVREHPMIVVENTLFRFRKILFESERIHDDFLVGLQDFSNRWGAVVLAAAITVLLWRRRLDRAAIVALPLVYALGSIGLVFLDLSYVRYAHLSYLLAVVVLAQEAATITARWLRAAAVRGQRRRGPRRGARPKPGRTGKRLRATLGGPSRLRTRRRLARVGIVIGVTAVGVAAAVLVAPGAVALRRHARDMELLAALRAGPTEPAGPVTSFDPTRWQKQVDGCTVTPAPGGFLLRTDDSTFSYQYASTIPTEGVDGVVLRANLVVESGGISVGAISGATGQWLDALSVSDEGRHEIERHVLIGDDENEILVVLANNNADGGVSEILLESVTVTPLRLGDTTSMPSRWIPRTESRAYRAWNLNPSKSSEAPPPVMKLASHGKAIDRSVITGLTVAALVLLAFWVRYQFFLVDGGAEPSYIDWAMQHYFGGITPTYLVMGEEIFSGKWPEHLAYPPGYGIFLQLAMMLEPGLLQPARLVQSGLDALSVVPLFLVLRRLGASAVVSMAGGLLYAVHPLFARPATFMLAESIVPALFLWILWAMTRAMAARSAWRWTVCGLLIGLAAVCRPDFVLLPIVVMFTILVIRRTWRVRVSAAAALGVAFAIPVGATGLLNRIHNGMWMFTSIAGSYALYSGLGQVPSDLAIVVDDQHWMEELDAMGIEWLSPESSRFFKERWWTTVREHPAIAVENTMFRFGKILFDAEAMSVEHLSELQAWVTRWGAVILVVVLVWMIVRRRRLDHAAIVALPLVYGLVSIGLVFYDARYVRYVQLSYLLALALLAQMIIGGGAAWLRRATVTQQRVMGVPPIVVTALLSGGSKTPLERILGGRSRRDARRRMACLGYLAAGAVLATIAAWWIGPRVNGLRAHARDVELIAALARSATPAGPVIRLDPAVWTGVAPASTLERAPTGWLLRTDANAFGYQHRVTVPTTAADGVRIEAIVHVRDGGIAVGGLSGRTGKWIDVVSHASPGRHEIDLIMSVAGENHIDIVLANNHPGGGASEILIEALTVSPLARGAGSLRSRWIAWEQADAMRTWREVKRRRSEQQID